MAIGQITKLAKHVTKLIAMADVVNGAFFLNYRRSVLASAIDTAGKMLDGQFVNLWEHAGLVTDKPSSDYKTWDWAPALQAAFDTGLPVVVVNGDFTWKTPVTYTNKNALFGYGVGNTVLKYRGPANTFGLVHAFTGDGSDQWPGRMRMADFTIQGDGTGNLGVGATVSGIRCSDDNVALVNIPFYNLTRVQFDKLQYGSQLEGYGHLFTDCWAEKCFRGYDFSHPEQAALMNCWANYCDIGVDINDHKLKAGHVMKIIGGSYQRCRIGIRAKNFYELHVDTYFELNTECDFQGGDIADPTNYTKGLKNLYIKCHSASNPGTANIDLYACNGTFINYDGYGGYNLTVPHVQANGYCKQTVVEYNPEGITSAVPFVFNGNSIGSAIARVRGGPERNKLPTMGTGYTSVASDPLSFHLVDIRTIRVSGSFSVTTGYTGNIFTLPTGYRIKSQTNFVCPMFAGSWSTTTLQVATNGAVTWNTPGDNRTVSLDITFERDDGFS
ncbi:hypothetical protein D3C85_734990 [compost metagenome]